MTNEDSPTNLNQPVVDLLQALLRRAEAGQITGIAVALAKPSGLAATAVEYGSSSINTLITGTVVLQHRIVEASETVPSEDVFKEDQSEVVPLRQGVAE